MKRFIIIYSVLALISSLAITGGSYWLDRNRVLKNAEVKADSLHKYVSASITFFEEHQKNAIKELLGDNVLYPELSLGCMVIRKTWETFAAMNPETGLHYKLATSNPTNNHNLANQEEEELISFFKGNPSVPKQKGLMEKDAQQVFFLASPLRVWNKKCLRCHGDPNDAPRYRVEMYGVEHGFNWGLEDVVSAKIVYVNIDEELRQCVLDAAKILLLSLACFLASLGCIVYVFKDEA